MSTGHWELASMAEVFTGTIEFNWYRSKSPNVVATKIDRLSVMMDDFMPPLVGARQILIDDMNDRFEHEVDLDGVPWVKLNDAYDSWKQTNYPGKTKLKLEDHLIDALNEPSAYPIVGNNLMINTSGFPPYWRIHDRGGYTTKSGFNPGVRKKIPQRSYLGISDAASFDVLGVFDDWIGGNLKLVIGPATGVAMETGMGHRITRRVGLGRQTLIKPLAQLRFR